MTHLINLEWKALNNQAVSEMLQAEASRVTEAIYSALYLLTKKGN
jgi:hypothetical protein